MKFATIASGNALRVAMVEGGTPARLLDARYSTVADIVTEAAEGARPSFGDGAPLPDGWRIVAPIPRPRRNIFCVGKNYREHAREFTASGFDSVVAKDAIPDAPIVFSKVPECVIGPDAAIIFGTGGRGIGKDRAMSHVWGYTIVNDVTARDVQSRMKQWHVGKSFDTFCPMGPWAVTADEIDLGDTTIRAWVNDELRQDANTRDLIFDVPTIIETISAGITLYPGDIIATGTPAGVGIGFNPPKYLKSGDIVRIAISGLGELRSPVLTMG
jgi:2-keto-4-pentenoate hydratase/2-oxohepta-3-ene-1,7-dioic acid hydratase in catechol pathway